MLCINLRGWFTPQLLHSFYFLLGHWVSGQSLTFLCVCTGIPEHRKADGAGGGRPGATGLAVQPSAASAAEPSAPSMHASASGAAANLAAMDAAIRGSGPSVSGEQLRKSAVSGTDTSTNRFV